MSSNPHSDGPIQQFPPAEPIDLDDTTDMRASSVAARQEAAIAYAARIGPRVNLDETDLSVLVEHVDALVQALEYGQASSLIPASSGPGWMDATDVVLALLAVENELARLRLEPPGPGMARVVRGTDGTPLADGPPHYFPQMQGTGYLPWTVVRLLKLLGLLRGGQIGALMPGWGKHPTRGPLSQWIAGNEPLPEGALEELRLIAQRLRLAQPPEQQAQTNEQQPTPLPEPPRPTTPTLDYCLYRERVVRWEGETKIRPVLWRLLKYVWEHPNGVSFDDLRVDVYKPKPNRGKSDKSIQNDFTEVREHLEKVKLPRRVATEADSKRAGARIARIVPD